MLLNKLKDDQIAARKERNEIKSNLLTTLVSEAAMVGKNATPPRDTTDEEVIRTVKKFLDNAKESFDIAMKSSREEAASKAQAEISILETYMPQQMSADEIEKAIRECRETNPVANMGQIMAYLKTKYAGQYDGKLASDIAKKVLA